MFLRRSAAALAAAAVLCGYAAPAALADDRPKGPSDKPAPKLPDGLYGKGDPKFDGVWRQSVALLAQDAAGAVPAAKAVDWLAGQQCADGSFAAYRQDPKSGCDPKKTPADTNATSLAVQALAAVGGQAQAVEKAVTWLKSAQNKDGGWGFGASGPSDANSTSVVIGALSAAGEKPGEVKKGGESPYDALLSLQVGCGTKGAKPKERGAFAYQPGKDGALAANDDATAAAALAALGEGMAVEPLGEKAEDRPLRPLDCGEKGKPSPETAADAGSAYLASVLEKNGGHLNSAMPGAEGQPDYANTADAVIALAAGGHSAPAQKSLDWLGRHLGDWDKAKNDPAALGILILAVHATGGDPTTLHGTDLLKRLDATGPAPAKTPAEQKTSDEDDGNGGAIAAWSAIIAGLAAGAGIGFLISGRRKRRGAGQ
ncbi:prenyltransferase/squalene oxidase repeat-containing protein [Streptomyces sp. ODS28]|uniref:prenyltransferase/squalene oxidase repeat-containing protein n=1 Tax=Streptomyces sp. ODS28 TaxID=3136688 RepID=UPI0031E702B9